MIAPILFIDFLLLLFFQDERQCQVFFEYPEFLCFHATYKVNNFRMPLHLITEDGNCRSETVGLWVIANTSEETIQAIIDIFSKTLGL